MIDEAMKARILHLLTLAQALVVDGRPTTWRVHGGEGPISGNPMYTIYTDEAFGEAVACLSFDHEDPEWDRKAHADFIAACNPQMILDIAEALNISTEVKEK